MAGRPQGSITAVSSWIPLCKVSHALSEEPHFGVVMWHTTRLGIRRPRSDSTVWSFRLLCTLAAVSSANWSLVYVVSSARFSPYRWPAYSIFKGMWVPISWLVVGFSSVTWLLCVRDVTSSNPGGRWAVRLSDAFHLRIIIAFASWISHSCFLRHVYPSIRNL